MLVRNSDNKSPGFFQIVRAAGCKLINEITIRCWFLLSDLKIHSGDFINPFRTEWLFILMNLS